MNRFLQKMKEGASKASEKAQNVLELNRVTSQIDALRKEWEHNTYEIGRLAFEAYKNKDYTSLGIEMDELAQANVILEEEIEQLEWKRCALRNEKRCTCGETAPWTANFCAVCGDKLPNPPELFDTKSENDAYEVEKQPEDKREAEADIFDRAELLQPYSDDLADRTEAGAEVTFSKYSPYSQSPKSASPESQERYDDEDDDNFNEVLTRSPQINIRGSERYIRQQPVDMKPIGKGCTKCSAQAPLEAKWCERCGAPFV